MKLKHLLEQDSYNTLKLRVDNPGGEWLKNKREDNDSGGRNDFGPRKYFGPVTASWNEPALIPVGLLASLKGSRGEQSRIRKDSFDGLTDVMGTTGKLPLRDTGEQYVPFITVDQDGEAWVSEGNHRIMVAKHLGWKYMPVEIRYFTGGEANPGPLAPAQVLKYNATASQLGYNTQNFGAQVSVNKYVNAGQ